MLLLGVQYTGCFFSNDTVRQDIAQPVLHLEISSMGQIKVIYVRFCMLSTKSFHFHVQPSARAEKKLIFCISDEKNMKK